MNHDPIVSAIREIREKLASEFGFDVHKIFADIRKRESQYGSRIVRQAVKRPANETRTIAGTVLDRGNSTSTAQ